MYTVKPILTRFDIEIPKCMYKMKIQDTCSTQEDQFLARLHAQDDPTNMAALAERQDIILEKLKELQGQLVSMKHSMRMCFKPPQNQFKAGEKVSSGKPPKGRCQPKVSVRDVVINVNPDFLPLSFPLLQKLWKKNLHLVFSFHTHSSVAQIPGETLAYQRVVEEQSEKNDKDVVFKIIWKGGNPNPEMILSPIDHVPIHSEVNILRFLSRIGPDYYNFEAKANATELDKIFDVCFKLANIEVEGERAQLIELLVNYLGDSLNQAELTDVSLVDLAIYSTLTRNKKALPKASGQKLTKWMKAVEVFCEKI